MVSVRSLIENVGHVFFRGWSVLPFKSTELQNYLFRNRKQEKLQIIFAIICNVISPESKHCLDLE